jgi:hypothetical protein
MKYMILFLTLTLGGCGKAPIATVATAAVPGVVATDFQPYVNQFQADALANNVSVTVLTGIAFGDTSQVVGDSVESQVVGFCDYGLNQITIQEAYWNSASTLEKKLLIYHELGHCVLQRAHLNTMENYSYCNEMGLHPTMQECDSGDWVSASRPVSIMNAMIPSDWEVNTSTANYMAGLIAELFN